MILRWLPACSRMARRSPEAPVNLSGGERIGHAWFCQCQQRPDGFASSTLHLAAIAGDVQVSACVAPGQPAVPDLFRDCGAAFEAPAGTSGEEASSSFPPARVSSRSPCGSPIQRFSPPSAGCERNLPGGGVASGDCAAAGFDRRNCGYQKSCRRSSCLHLGSRCCRTAGTGHASALHGRNSRSACDPGHGRGRKQPASLPATVALAGGALAPYSR